MTKKVRISFRDTEKPYKKNVNIIIFKQVTRKISKTIINNPHNNDLMKEVKKGKHPDKVLERDIAKLISRSDHPEDPKHSLLAKKWLLKLRSNAPYYLQIAALAHDIDRAVYRIKWNPEIESYDHYKEAHAKRSVFVINNLLKKHNYSFVFRNKVAAAVKRHEVGGTPNSNLVRDADSLSFFENNIKYMMKRHIENYTVRKIRYMYDRAGPKAQELMRKMKQPPRIKKLVKKAIDHKHR